MVAVVEEDGAVAGEGLGAAAEVDAAGEVEREGAVQGQAVDDVHPLVAQGEIGVERDAVEGGAVGGEGERSGREIDGGVGGAPGAAEIERAAAHLESGGGAPGAVVGDGLAGGDGDPAAEGIGAAEPEGARATDDDRGHVAGGADDIQRAAVLDPGRSGVGVGARPTGVDEDAAAGGVGEDGALVDDGDVVSAAGPFAVADDAAVVSVSDARVSAADGDAGSDGERHAVGGGDEALVVAVVEEDGAVAGDGLGATAEVDAAAAAE